MTNIIGSDHVINNSKDDNGANDYDPAVPGVVPFSVRMGALRRAPTAPIFRNQYSMLFDGNTDGEDTVEWIETDDSWGTIMGTTAVGAIASFTVSAWVKLTDTSADYSVCSFWCDASGGQRRAGMWVGARAAATTTKINVVMNDDGVGATATQYSYASSAVTYNVVNNWAHVAVVMTATGGTFYINGSAAGTFSPETGEISGNNKGAGDSWTWGTGISNEWHLAPLGVGALQKYRAGSSSVTKYAGPNSAAAPMKGHIDELSLWSAALTSGNITTIYNSGAPADLVASGISGLKLWYRMGDSGGDSNTVIKDASGNARDAVPENMEAGDIVKVVP